MRQPVAIGERALGFNMHNGITLGYVWGMRCEPNTRAALGINHRVCGLGVNKTDT